MSDEKRLDKLVEKVLEATEPQEKLRRAGELLESVGKDKEIRTFANDDIDRLVADIKNQADKNQESE